MDQGLLAVVARKTFTKLLQRPSGGRMGRDIAVHNPPRANFHQDKDVQLAKAYRHHDEEIAGQQRSGVIANEAAPALR
jgi:hypothetical protein